MSDKIETAKCSVRDGSFVEPCTPLQMVTDVGGISKAKGIAVWQYFSTKNYKPSRTYYGVRSKGRPDGLAFNFCPFCGEAISAPFMAEEVDA